LVTYHFKTIANLLDELCRRNLAPIAEAWARIGSPEAEGAALDDILRDWLSPMLAPAAYTPGGRALVVLDEIAAHGEERLRDRVLAAMEEFSRRLRLALAPYCPELPEDDLRARLRFISGAVLGPPPRSHGAPDTAGGRTLDDLDFLLPFARAALRC
jgi:AcrR family transcriptional regulator